MQRHLISTIIRNTHVYQPKTNHGVEEFGGVKTNRVKRGYSVESDMGVAMFVDELATPTFREMDRSAFYALCPRNLMQAIIATSRDMLPPISSLEAVMPEVRGAAQRLLAHIDLDYFISRGAEAYLASEAQRYPIRSLDNKKIQALEAVNYETGVPFRVHTNVSGWNPLNLLRDFPQGEKRDWEFVDLGSSADSRNGIYVARVPFDLYTGGLLDPLTREPLS